MSDDIDEHDARIARWRAVGFGESDARYKAEIERLTADRDAWEEAWKDLETSRAACCDENEREVERLRAEVERLTAEALTDPEAGPVDRPDYHEVFRRLWGSDPDARDPMKDEDAMSIRGARMARGLTLREAAEACEMSIVRFGEIERGAMAPATPEELHRVCTVLRLALTPSNADAFGGKAGR